VLAEATGDAELMLWDGREFGHWSEGCKQSICMPR
jgi:hypothetical protein